jgi:hypothetical protein
MARYPQILGNTQDTSMIKRVKETRPWHIRVWSLHRKPKILSHKEETSEDNKERERELVAQATVLCLGNTLTLYTFSECFPDTLFRKQNTVLT